MPSTLSPVMLSFSTNYKDFYFRTFTSIEITNVSLPNFKTILLQVLNKHEDQKSKYEQREKTKWKINGVYAIGTTGSKKFQICEGDRIWTNLIYMKSNRVPRLLNDLNHRYSASSFICKSFQFLFRYTYHIFLKLFSSDLFTKLPVEVLFEIMQQMTDSDLDNLCLSSSYCNNVWNNRYDWCISVKEYHINIDKV